MSRPGKTRKEIYFSNTEIDLLKNVQSITGLDRTNCIRLLIHFGYHCLVQPQDNVGNNEHFFMKATNERLKTGQKPAQPLQKIV